MATKEELAARIAAMDAERAAMEAELDAAKAETAEADALESDKQRVIAAHDARKAFCVAELAMPLAERTLKDHSQEPRDDEAINAELQALDVDCARMVAVHDEALAVCRARLARAKR